MPRRRASRQKPIVAGLTGGFGSGKSTVLKMFKRKGAFVLDADAIVHGLFRAPVVQKKIFRTFGTLDKKALAEKIFTSKSERRRLEKILHPLVRETMARILRARRGGVAVLDIPLLFESGWHKELRPVVVVWAGEQTRVGRLIKKGFERKDIRARMRAQWPLKRKARFADFVINNDGTKKETKVNVNAVWNQITNLNNSRHPRMP